MGKIIYIVWALLPLIGVLIGDVEARTKCWICNSESEPKCGDPFDNSTFPISDCNAQSEPSFPPKVTFCLKMRHYWAEDKKWVYQRGCVFLKEGEVTSDYRYRTFTDDSGTSTDEWLCRNQDGCNTGSTVTPEVKTVLTIISSFLLFQGSFW